MNEELQRGLLEEWLEVLEDQNIFRNVELPAPEIFIRDILGYELEWFQEEWLHFQIENQASLILAPRGHGKSTICTVCYPLWKLLRNPDLKILIVSNTQAQACAFLREIRANLESNDWIRDNFHGLAGRPWSEDELNLKIRRSIGKEASLTAMGVFGPIISKHYDIIILDDIVDEETAMSARQRERLRLWYYKTLLPCLEPDGEIHIMGTRYHYLDLYGHLINAEFNSHHRVYRAITDTESGEQALWENKFSLALLKARRRDAGPAIFNSQYQNDVEMMKGSIFRPEWIRYYSSPAGKLEKIMGIDLAISEKESADYFALTVAGRDRRDGKIYVLDAVRARLSFSKQLNLALNYFEKHDLPDSVVIRVAVESNGFQEAFAQKLREAGLPVKSVVRVRDKVSRAFQIQARFENGEIFFPKTGAEDLVRELLLFPEAEHDDLFDALEIAVTQFKQISYQRYLLETPDISPLS
jgi:predicted phage terminase large subunit-like protein